MIPRDVMETLLFAAGVGQLGVLIASALVPVRLKWSEELAPLPVLVRQLFWVYGGYVVMGIVVLGVTCLFNAGELAAGGRLARWVCGYGALFWGVRLSLQAVLDVRGHLTTWWLRAGYHGLTVMFVYLTAVYSLAAAGLAG